MPAELQFQVYRGKSRSRLTALLKGGCTVKAASLPRRDRLFASIRTIGLCAMILLVSVAACGADDQGDATSGVPLDRVIVTATRTPQDESQLGSAFSQLTGQQMQTEQLIDLKNALNTTPGAYALEGGARGGITTLSLRGTTSSYALFLVDGIKINSGIFDNGSPFLTYAQTYNLDTVDIVRGPYSTLYGSAAIGGVVSLATHEGSGTPKAMLFGEAGTYDSLRGGVVSDGSFGKVDYSFSYVHDETANARPNNYLREDGYSLRLDAAVTPDVTVGVTARGMFGRYEEPSSDRPVDIPFDDPHAKATGETNVFSLFVNWKTTDWWQQRFLIGGYNERYSLIDPPIPSEFFGGSIYIANAFNFQADWQNTIQLPASNVVVTGFTYYLDAGHDNSFSEQDEYDVAVYLQDQWQALPGLNFTAGGRYDHYEFAGDAFTYRFTGAYLFAPTNTKIRASYGTAFKAPDLFDTFSTSPFAFGNRNLRPEKSQGFDTGIDQSLWDDKVAMSASFFHNYIHDVIAFVPTGEITGFFENQNTGETYGVELELRAQPTKEWQVRGAFTWTESYATADGVTQRNINIPRYLLSFDTNYKFPYGITIGFGATYAAQREGEDFSFFPAKFVELGDYWDLRAYARWDITSNFALTFRGENLADQHYETTIGFPALGTALFCGAEIRF
jgi:vitamin B12 transporter